MNVVLATLKKLFRPISIVVRQEIAPLFFGISKTKMKKNLLKKNVHDSEYVFSRKDIELYVEEKFVKLKKIKLSEADDPTLVKISIDGKLLYWPSSLPIDDLPWLYHEIFDSFISNPSSYDHPALSYSDRSWIMDAGAAEGWFSLFALEKSSAKIFSIEPLEIMRSALEMTLALKASKERFEVVSAGLSDVGGMASIVVDKNHICDSRLVENSVGSKTDDSNNIQNVAIMTIDQLVDEYSLGSTGLIKMDIEGFEMAALKGAAKTMQVLKPALAIAVYHEFENAMKCAEIIKSANSEYKIEFRGYYGYFDPPRPYMIFAY